MIFRFYMSCWKYSMATFAALGFPYADVLRQPYATLRQKVKQWDYRSACRCWKNKGKCIQKTLGGAQTGFRLRQPYANLTPAHVFERAVSGHGFA